MQQETVYHRFAGQYQQSQKQGRCQNLVDQGEVKARADGKEEQDQEKIPQRFQVDRDVLGDRAGGDGDAGDESPDFLRQPHGAGTLRETQAPPQGQQENILVKTVIAADQWQQRIAHHHPGARGEQWQAQQRQRQVAGHVVGGTGGGAEQHHQYDDRQQVLQQQQPDHQLADMAVMQHGGG